MDIIAKRFVNKAKEMLLMALEEDLELPDKKSIEGIIDILNEMLHKEQKEYLCHMTIECYDEGLKSITKAMPTVKVFAENENEARYKARAKILTDYYTERSGVAVQDIKFDLIKEL